MSHFHLEVQEHDILTSTLIESQAMNLVALLKPKFTKDGNIYCFLYGDNLQEGIAGFGETPYAAALNFNHNWYNIDKINNRT